VNHKIAFVAATDKEIEPLLNYLRSHAEQHSFQTFQLHGLLIDIIYTGIGILKTTYTLMDYLSHRHPDGWIQVGIGGAFDQALPIGSVYQIQSELISGFGAEDTDGSILDAFTLGWNDPNRFPFTEGALECPYDNFLLLPSATGMTTFHAHGEQRNIDRLRLMPNGQIENMEGAAFFYISLLKKIPFLSIRSISNVVEARDKSKWKMEMAIQNLNDIVLQMLEKSNLNIDKLFRLKNL
jgi:futalosine hydrolase